VRSAEEASTAALALFDGSGELRELCRSVDWAATPLGPVSKWSQSLRQAVRLCLECRSALALWVGPEFTLIHNEAYAVVLGNKHPKAMGRPLREVWSEVWEELAGDFRRVLTEGASIGYHEAKYRLHRDASENGSENEAYFAYSLTPLREPDGRVIGVFNVVEETTLLVRARLERERQYQESEEELRRAVVRYEEQVRLFESVTSTTPDFVYVFDRQGRFVYANRRLLEVWGMQLSEALGRTCRELGYEQWHHDMHMREIAQVIETRQSIKGEVPFEAPRTGIAGVYEYIFTPVIGASGEVELIAGTTRDVTERKHGVEALRESEARLRRLWESGMLGVLFFDLTGGITDANDRFLALVGYTRDDLEAGRVSWSAMTPAEYRAADEHAIAELRACGVDTPYEKEFIRKDGSRVSVYIGAATFDSEKHRGIAFVLDISESKDLERALRRANQQLVEADRRKNHFLAVLSHELRNPLTPIKNGLYILDRAVPGGDQARRAKEVIERQVDQLSHLVNDLLDVTRITRGKIKLHCRRLELNELVRRTSEDHRALLQKSDITLEVRATAEPVMVDADPNRLAQALGNLLQNAAKFTPPGGRVVAALECDQSANQAVLSVADSGCGMSPELLVQLFEPFMQADETLDRSTGGLGLGLALVKGIAELHGGTVEAKSDGPGCGSEFIMRLPLALAAHETAESAPAPALGLRRRVLIIEDNLDAAETLRDLLELRGHEVSVAYDGRAGLEQARACPPEVCICDIGLPGMDGYAVARAFRADEALQSVRLVALSGYALPEDQQRAADAGFERHLAKPPTLAKLEDVLGQVAETSS
jgi:PAS domain S-box-containing protein